MLRINPEEISYPQSFLKRKTVLVMIFPCIELLAGDALQCDGCSRWQHRLCDTDIKSDTVIVT